MSKHTRGPWTVHSNGTIRQLDPLSHGELPKNDADKLLMASAPDLLGACEALVEAYERGEDSGSSIDWEDLDSAYRAALEAVAKAKGKQS